DPSLQQPCRRRCDSSTFYKHAGRKGHRSTSARHGASLIWANPVPVTVVLVPIRGGLRVGIDAYTKGNLLRGGSSRATATIPRTTAMTMTTQIRGLVLSKPPWRRALRPTALDPQW